MEAVDLLGIITGLIGLGAVVLAVVRVLRTDTANMVEIQHSIWEETRAQLEDCRATVERLRARLRDGP